MFRDRAEAGRTLAAALRPLGLVSPVVYALPRGGVPVAAEIAAALQAPLDLVLVRKIGERWNPEYAIAAVAEGDPPVLVLNDGREVPAASAPGDIAERLPEHLAEIARRDARYRAGRPRLPAAGRDAVLVDDGVATGTTTRAAIVALRRQRPSRLVLAVPVGAPESIDALRPLVDDLVCPEAPPGFLAVGMHYRDFHQVEDDEVIAALAHAAAH